MARGQDWIDGKQFRVARAYLSFNGGAQRVVVIVDDVEAGWIRELTEEQFITFVETGNSHLLAAQPNLDVDARGSKVEFFASPFATPVLTYTASREVMSDVLIAMTAYQPEMIGRYVSTNRIAYCGNQWSYDQIAADMRNDART